MAEKKKYNYAKELTKGFLKENPVLRLVLGTCPTLATSTSVVNGVGMGIAATIVLICSNAVISAMRKVIPEKARIPAYIVIIASFVTVVQMLVKAFVPALDASLGVFLPLIVVNCIILGRAEAYASKNPVLVSAVDGLGMGIGFTAALFCMGAIREIFGAGTFLSGIDTMLGSYIDLGSFTGFDFTDELASIGFAPMTLFILPAGGFFVFGMLMALANKLAEKKGLESATLNGCKGCPHASFCSKFSENGENVTEECAEKSAQKEEEEKESKTAKTSPAEKQKLETKTEEKETLKEEEETENKDSSEDTVNETEEVSEKLSRKKNRKRKKKEQPQLPDFSEPLPEVIPDFLKKDMNNNKETEEDAE